MLLSLRSGNPIFVVKVNAGRFARARATWDGRLLGGFCCTLGVGRPAEPERHRHRAPIGIVRHFSRWRQVLGYRNYSLRRGT